MMDEQELLNRWRLVLGKYAAQELPFSGDALHYMDMEEALDFLYSREYSEEQGIRQEDRAGGRENSKLTVPSWLQRVKKLFPRYAERHFGSEEYRTLTPIMKESYKLIVNEDLRDCAAKIQNDCLLVYGAGDTTTPPAEEGATFNGLIANSRLETISGGHFCFSENAEAFNSLMTDFFEI